ncbi:MAG: cell division protein ZapA [Rickettsia endosymbiont of Pseudomimeciton antennatum]|nr:cell division protein ZapA [Rickettsia endosymbiont of Pseudomimeciton antennatum]MCC8397860.1 cell division protein ZapA [Rickettsia endosymbiont of Labidopullus appendiculatus]
MSIVTIILGSKTFQLACSDGSEEELCNLATKLNENITQIKKVSPSASFELLLVMSALSLQEQVQNLTNKIAKIDGDKIPCEEEKFAETLSTIAGYLEDLARKIGK